MEKHNIKMDIPSSHPRHANLFPVEQIERRPSFNPDEPQGVSWVKDLPKLVSCIVSLQRMKQRSMLMLGKNATQEAYLDEFFRGRLRALQPVDELVEDVVKKLEEAGELDNTYIFYTGMSALPAISLHVPILTPLADNGYALGSHRRQPGKTLGYEEDIHVPLIVRGPSIRKGFRDTLSSYGIVDLSRTILDIAGGSVSHRDDGVKINLHQSQETVEEAHKLARHSLSEYWVLGAEEGIYANGVRFNNSES